MWPCVPEGGGEGRGEERRGRKERERGRREGDKGASQRDGKLPLQQTYLTKGFLDVSPPTILGPQFNWLKPLNVLYSKIYHNMHETREPATSLNGTDLC